MQEPALRRPLSVTLLTLGGLSFTVWYAIRLVAGLSLPPLPLSVPEWYLPLTGAVWVACGLLALAGLVRHRPWAPAVIGWTGLVYVLWRLADRLLLARSDYAARTLPGMAGLLLLSLAAVWWMLRRPAARSFFQESAP
jgi:arginine exporter protein ArgO